MSQEIETGMNLYDMNKQIIQQNGKQLSVYALNEKLKQVVAPFFRKTKQEMQPKYFMLLCHEKRDYTLFRLDWFSNECDLDAAATLKECLQNRGLIYSIDWDNINEVALEIWLHDGEGVNCYYLFPYDEGVIEV